MKSKSFAFLVAIAWLVIMLPMLTGCINIPKTVAALAKDPSSAHISVKSIYVSIDYTRTNPGTNTPAHTMSPTGVIEVKR